MKEVYLDNAATTAIAPEVLDAMMPYLTTNFGNPSALYVTGRVAWMAVEAAREQVAAHIGCEPDEIYFTSGGSEANALAMNTIFWNHREYGMALMSPFEHHSIDAYKAGAFITEKLDVDEFGVVKSAGVAKALEYWDYTDLVTVMMVNNEIGSIQPIKEIAEICHKRPDGYRRVPFHTDAVQALPHLPINVKELGVDMLSASGHKIHAPKGVGFLYVNKDFDFDPIICGTQERGKRGGTENVASIVGLGKAVELLGDAQMMLKREAKIAECRNYFEDKVMQTIPEVEHNGTIIERVSSISDLRFKGIEAEQALLALDIRGVSVSTGSACNMQSGEPSHVLKAIGLSDKEANSSLRFSLDEHTTKDDVDYAVEQLADVIKDLRQQAGYDPYND